MWFLCAGLRVGGWSGWDHEKCTLLGAFVLDVRGAEYKKHTQKGTFLLLNVRDGVRKALGTKNMPLRVFFCAQCEE